MRWARRWACAGIAAIVLASPAVEADTLYVVRRGWHTDVGFAVPELGAGFGSVVGEFPGVQYLFFSFGDEHYLRARNHGFPTMFAALWPGRGLILVTALDATPAAAFGAGHVIAVHVSASQSAAAQRFIAQSISAGAPMAGPYTGSSYFPTGSSVLGPAHLQYLVSRGVGSGRVADACPRGHFREPVMASRAPVCRLTSTRPTSTAASMTGRARSVLAYDGGRFLWYHDSRVLVGRGRTAAADATGQQTGHDD